MHMGTLGYILSNKGIKELPQYIEVIKDFREYCGDKPLLVVGFKLAKEVIPNFDVLDNGFGHSNIMWTLSKYEDRDRNEKDIKMFYETVLENTYSSYRYSYVNVAIMRPTDTDRLIGKLKDMRIKVFDSWNNYYILADKTVFGVSKELLEYCGYEDRFKSVIRRAKEVMYVSSEERNTIRSNTRGVVPECFLVVFSDK